MTAPPPPESRPGEQLPPALPSPPARPAVGERGPRWGGDGALRAETGRLEAERLDVERRETEARAIEQTARVTGPPAEPVGAASAAARETPAAALPVGLELARLWRRAIAWSIDFVLKSVVFQVVMLTAGVTEVSYPLPVAILIAGQLLSRGYDWIFFVRGRSPGGWAMGIRIVRIEDGGEPGVRRAFARTIGALLSELALGIGFAWALRNPRRQTWHDSMARTVVVDTPRERR